MRLSFETWVYICFLKNRIVEDAEDLETEILHGSSPCHVTSGSSGFCYTGRPPYGESFGAEQPPRSSLGPLTSINLLERSNRDVPPAFPQPGLI